MKIKSLIKEATEGLHETLQAADSKVPCLKPSNVGRDALPKAKQSSLPHYFNLNTFPSISRFNVESHWK